MNILNISPTKGIYSEGITKRDISTSVGENSLTFTRISDQNTVVLNINVPSVATKFFYFEAKMTLSNNSIAVGMSPDSCVTGCLSRSTGRPVDLALPPYSRRTDWQILFQRGWPCDVSYSYHGDTGKVWHKEIGTVCGSSLRTNDVIGCGIDVKKRCIFFTLNGDKLNATFNIDPTRNWYPLIGLRGDGSEVEVNLTKSSFVYQPSRISTGKFPKPDFFQTNGRRK